MIPAVLDESIKEVSNARRKLGEEWASWGTKKGTHVKFHLSKSQEDLATAITRAAKKLPSGIIVMASQTGSFVSAIMGSVTRLVIRSATCPTLVLHPPKLTLSGRRPKPAEETLERGSALLS